MGLSCAEYALIVDDDERLVGGETLRAVVRWRVPRVLDVRVYNLKPNGPPEEQRSTRLLSLRTGVRFDGPIHETAAGVMLRSPAVSRPYLVHYGYSSAGVTLEKYFGRNYPLARAHGSGKVVHPRTAGVLMRDAIGAYDAALRPDASGTHDDLAGAVAVFRRAVIDVDDWWEYV